MIFNGCIRLIFCPEFSWQQKYFLLQVILGYTCNTWLIYIFRSTIQLCSYDYSMISISLLYSYEYLIPENTGNVIRSRIKYSQISTKNILYSLYFEKDKINLLQLYLRNLHFQMGCFC